MANTNEAVRTNVKFKDRLFRIIFGAEENKKHLISLYNALNGTEYGENEEVEITTLDDAIYIRMKNDISFIIASDLSLYEQQSTFNPNMPLRGYSDFIALVRRNQKTQEFDTAVDNAVVAAQERPCIGPYLYKNRNEVREVLLTEFDEELHDRATYDAGFAEGEVRGEIRGRVTVLAGLVVNGLLSLEDAVSQAGLKEEEFIRQARQLNIFINQ